MSSALHQRMLAFNYDDPERSALMERVWRDTPWMVDVYSGGYSRDRDREHEILTWCFEQFGDQCSPLHDRPGRWQRGSATIDGWTWFGFCTESEMQAFVDRWPAPEGVSAPS